jgi:hypothetical protein
LRGTKPRPVNDILALIQVSTIGYHWDQIASRRIGFEHGFEILIKNSGVYTVGDISTIAGVNGGLALTIGQPIEQASNFVRARVYDLVGFPTACAFAAGLKIQYHIARLITETLHRDNR